jgi:hypothetical protein
VEEDKTAKMQKRNDNIQQRKMQKLGAPIAKPGQSKEGQEKAGDSKGKAPTNRAGFEGKKRVGEFLNSEKK